MRVALHTINVSKQLILPDEEFAILHTSSREGLLDRWEFGLEIDRILEIERADPDQLLGASSSRGFARRISGGEGIACGCGDGRPLLRPLAGRGQVT